MMKNFWRQLNIEEDQKESLKFYGRMLIVLLLGEITLMRKGGILDENIVFYRTFFRISKYCIIKVVMMSIATLCKKNNKLWKLAIKAELAITALAIVEILVLLLRLFVF